MCRDCLEYTTKFFAKQPLIFTYRADLGIIFIVNNKWFDAIILNFPTSAGALAETGDFLNLIFDFERSEGGYSITVLCILAMDKTRVRLPLPAPSHFVRYKFGLVAEELGRGLQNPVQQCKSAPDLQKILHVPG